MDHIKLTTLSRLTPYLIGLFTLLLSFPAFNQASGRLTVDRMAICQDVRDREPYNPDNSFSVSNNRIFCFSAIKGARDSSYVFHVWFFNDKEVSRIKLPVRSALYRTWSARTLSQADVGKWRVDIITRGGRLLAAEEFLVEQ